MKSLIAAPLALLSLVAAASAADLPPRSGSGPLYAAVPAFTWTGFYAGVHAGYLFGDVDASLGRAPGFGGPGVVPDRLRIDRSGAMLGAQAGYSIQTGLFVYGLELDLSAADANGAGRRLYIDPTPRARLSNATEARASLDALGTVRGRVGVAFDRTLVYATGGLAYGDVNLKGSIRPGSRTASFAAFDGRTDDVRLGYAVGAGVEYAVTGNLTVRAEYLYHDLGTETVNLRQAARGAGSGGGASYAIDNDGHAARLGLNVKF